MKYKIQAVVIQILVATKLRQDSDGHNYFYDVIVIERWGIEFQCKQKSRLNDTAINKYKCYYCLSSLHGIADTRLELCICNVFTNKEYKILYNMCAIYMIIIDHNSKNVEMVM